MRVMGLRRAEEEKKEDEDEDEEAKLQSDWQQTPTARFSRKIPDNCMAAVDMDKVAAVAAVAEIRA